MNDEILPGSDDPTPVVATVTKVCGRDGCKNTMTGRPADIPADCGLHERQPIETVPPRNDNASEGGTTATFEPIENGDVEDSEPPAPRAHIYRCARGHEQRGAGASYAIDRETNAVIATSGPVCQRCELEWRGKRFRTVDTGKEAPLPEGVEN